MAIQNTSVWEIRTTGADTNGSGYDAGIAGAGTDYSQQAAPQLSLTDCVTNGTTTVTSATGGFTAAMIGNGMYMSGAGVTTSGVYFITGFTNSNTVTVDRAPGTGSGNTGRVGGAAASPGFVWGQAVGGNLAYLASGTYTVTSASTNIAGGCVSMPATAAAGQATRFVGYTTTRGDGAPTQPIIIANGVITTFTLITTALANYVEGITCDGNNRTSSRGFAGAASTFSTLVNCRGQNCTNSAFGTIHQCIRCYATGCATVSPFTSVDFMYACVADTNTVTGITVPSNGYVDRCYSINNTGSTAVHGFSYNCSGQMMVNCVAYGNAGSGFNNSSVATGRRDALVNCHAENNAVNGFTAAAANDVDLYLNCSGFNNTSGNTNNAVARNLVNFINATASPFTNAAGKDFSLNTNATGGALLRAAGVPGALAANSLPGISTLSYVDIGGAQHKDPVAGGGRTMSSTIIFGGWQ
jgi:hypothetical protein